MKKFIKVCAYIILSTLLLICLGGLFQSISTIIDQKKFQYPGKLIKVNGLNMHYIPSGTKNSSSPLLVFIGGLGATSSTWTIIQSELSTKYQCISFDRPGYGWSDVSNTKRDAVSIVSELHQMLQNAGYQPPYIIIGHSLGGIYAQEFSSKYSTEVSALILLESMHPDQFKRTSSGKKELANIDKNLKMASIVAVFGLMRLNNMCVLPSDFPKKESNEIRSFCASSTIWKTQAAEMDAIDSTFNQGTTSTLPNSLPILIVSAGEHIKDNQWKIFQKEFLKLSAHTRSVVIEGATHTSLWASGKDANQISKEIVSFLGSLK